jgi:hypothetical protein
MVGAHLERDIERDIDALLARFGDEASEILESAKLRVNRLVASRFATDGPGAAMVLLRRARLVVRPFALGKADRVNRRQIQHVEAHRRDIGEARFYILKRAVLSGLRACGARKQLVPR